MSVQPDYHISDLLSFCETTQEGKDRQLFCSPLSPTSSLNDMQRKKRQVQTYLPTEVPDNLIDDTGDVKLVFTTGVDILSIKDSPFSFSPKQNFINFFADVQSINVLKNGINYRIICTCAKSCIYILFALAVTA